MVRMLAAEQATLVVMFLLHPITRSSDSSPPIPFAQARNMRHMMQTMPRI